jgi:hypothetical protein
VIVQNKSGEKVNISEFDINNEILDNTVLADVEQLAYKAIKFNLETISSKFVSITDDILSRCRKLTGAAALKIVRFYDMLSVARTRVINELSHVLNESSILGAINLFDVNKTKYGYIKSISAPGQIYPVLHHLVVSQHSVSRSLASHMATHPGHEYELAELCLMDKLVGEAAKQKAHCHLQKMIQMGEKLGSHNDELCSLSTDGGEIRAIFVAVGDRPRSQPNLNPVSQIVGSRRVSLVASSEVKYDAFVKTTIGCGTDGGGRSGIVVKVPYFSRSYIVLKHT